MEKPKYTKGTVLNMLGTGPDRWARFTVLGFKYESQAYLVTVQFDGENEVATRLWSKEALEDEDYFKVQVLETMKSVKRFT